MASNVICTHDSTGKGSLCNMWRLVYRRLPQDTYGKVQESVRLPKCLPDCRVGVHVNLCESNHVAQHLCQVCGQAAGRYCSRRHVSGNSTAVRTCERVSTANNSPVPLMVWQ